MPVSWHSEAPEDLRESIRFTAEQTGFTPRLIEKDYFCSVVLEALAEADTPLLFKGGTCLAKIHSGFFRLSEDLDFSIPTAPEATRADRSRSIAPIKALVAASTQYNATVGYRSLLQPQTETIAIEIGLREPALTPAELGQVHTAVLHWAQGDALLDTFPAQCLSYREAMAEKLRAALSRLEVAIRDFFDIDHAVRSAGFDVTDRDLLRLLRSKFAVSGTGPMNVSPERLEQLRPQVESRLRPVLRQRELEQFDLDRAFTLVRRVADQLR